MKRSGTIYLLFFHGGLLLVVFFAFHLAGLFPMLPGKDTLLHWDAEWYWSIVRNGYRFTEGEQNNLAFFPAFPYLWKALHLDSAGISAVNVLIAFGSFILLAKILKADNRELLLSASAPALVFCALPYTESLFFLGGVMILKGLKEEKNIFILPGLFLAAITKPAAMIFIPAILALFLYKKASLQKTALYLFVLLCAVVCVAYIQWVQTGKWLHFFEVQHYWNKAWQFPSFPLTTYGDSLILLLDGAAFTAGIISLWFLCIPLFNKNDLPELNAPEVFSFTFLSCTAMAVIFFSISDAEENTSLTSINRYLCATPFFTLFCIRALRNNKKISFVAALILAALTALLFIAPMKGWELSIPLTAMILLSVLPFTVSRLRNSFPLFLFLYLVNTLLQVWLLNMYLSGKWIG